MTVGRLDHVAIPVDDMEPMIGFYRSLGFTVDDEYAPLLYSVCQGDMKVNLHSPKLWRSEKFDLRGPTAEPGSGDLCMVWDGDEATLEALLVSADVEVIEGPVERVGGKNGGTTTGVSRYCRDPEGNLLEFIVYPS
jgi:catechol 2,3-dioxygenase-like lactoylglutathione lyase family enzyme